MQGGRFTASVNTRSGVAYRIEYQDGLEAPGWIALPTVPGDNSEKVLDDPNPAGPHRFYRVRAESQ